MAAGLGFKDFTTGEVLTAADVDGYLMQGIWVFASNAARDAAVTAPAEGNFAFTKDTNSLWYYDGAAWVASGATGDIEGVTAGVGISGGGTSGTVTITNSMATAIDAKGDLIAGTGADTFSRLAVGTNGHTLVADSSTATGLKWAAPAGASLPTFSAYDTASQSLSANTATKITYTTENWDEGSCYTSSTFTPTTAGYYQVTATFDIQPTSSSNIWLKLYKNGSAWASLDERYAVSGELVPLGTTTVYLNGTTDYVEIYGYSSQSATVYKGQTYAWFTAVGIRS